MNEEAFIDDGGDSDSLGEEDEPGLALGEGAAGGRRKTRRKAHQRPVVRTSCVLDGVCVHASDLLDRGCP